MSRLVRAAREVLDAWAEDNPDALVESMERLEEEYERNRLGQIERQRRLRERRREAAQA